MIAWLAPGQGAERPGMGQSVAARWPQAAALLPPAGLQDTARVQPALVAVALGAAAALAAEGVRCDLVAGHSVGELAAWAIAGGVDFPAAVALAAARGAAMRAAAAANPGRMWAVDALPSHLGPDLVLAVENVGQLVLSGPGAPPPGARLVPTGGAWHSPAMALAVAPFAEALAAVPARALAIPVVSNHDGRPTTDDATVRRHLVAQLTAPVRFAAVLDALLAAGCADVVLLGPGKDLAAQLARRGGFRVHRTDRAEDVAATSARLTR